MNEKKVIERKPLEEREKEMIKVSDNYLIDTDSYNYVVRRKGVEAALGFFGNFKSALENIYERMLKDELQDARDLKDSIKAFEKVNDEFKQIINTGFPSYEVAKKK